MWLMAGNKVFVMSQQDHLGYYYIYHLNNNKYVKSSPLVPILTHLKPMLKSPLSLLDTLGASCDQGTTASNDTDKHHG